MTSHEYYLPNSPVILSFLRNYYLQLEELAAFIQAAKHHQSTVTLSLQGAPAGPSACWTQQQSCCPHSSAPGCSGHVPRTVHTNTLRLGSKLGFIMLAYMHTDYFLAQQKQVCTQPRIS